MKKEGTSSTITRTSALTRLVRDDRNKSQCDSKSSRRPRIASVIILLEVGAIRNFEMEDLFVSPNYGVLGEIASLRMIIGVL